MNKMLLTGLLGTAGLGAAFFAAKKIGSQEYEVPTATYNISNSYNIDLSADSISDAIAGAISDEHLDPDNVVIMMAGYHNALSHQYFDMSLAGNLKEQYPDLTYGLETSPNTMENLAAFKDMSFDRLNFCNYLRYVADETDYYVWSLMPILATHMNDIDCESIDIGKKDRNQVIDGRIPQDFLLSCQSDQFFAELLEANPDVTNEKVELSCEEEDGILKRDLYMAARILEIQNNKRSIILTSGGLAHLADSRNPDRPTLMEMLAHKHKDIIVVEMQVEGNPGNINTERNIAFEEVYDRIPDEDRQHIYRHFIISLQDYTFFDPNTGQVFDNRFSCFALEELMRLQFSGSTLEADRESKPSIEKSRTSYETIFGRAPEFHINQ